MDYQQLSKRYTLLIVIASVVYVCYHLLTLAYSPLPWFDEVAFASITESYMKHHTFVEDARHLNWHGEKLMYGPIYFVWQAMLAKTFGMGIFTFRITALLFGFINLFLVYKVCRYLGFTTLATVLTVTIVALDPSYNQFLHSGRMDMVTLFFFLASYLVFVKVDYNSGRYALHGLVTGLLLACAMLTNPRISFTLAFYACYFIYELATKRAPVGKIVVKYGMVLVALLALYGAWIYGKFGSLQNFIAVNYTNSKVMKDHVGFTLKEVKLNQSLLLYRKKQAGRNAELLLLTVPVIIGFMLVVSGGITGRYYASVVPFTTLLITGALVSLPDAKIYRVIAWSIVGVFAAVFVVKGLTVAATLSDRDEAYYRKAIIAVVPQHVTVASDFPYYYMMQNNNDTFQCLEENGEFPEKVAYFKKVTFDYLIINAGNTIRSYYEEHMMMGRYELVAHISNKKPVGFLQRIARLLPYRIQDSYSCYIYKLKAGVTRVPG
jgi:4-amino-4-deoxy-L-arabinose transferase-like glycosyltransferase